MRKLTADDRDPRSLALYQAILRLDNLEDCIRFFEDLCAVTELRTLEQRYDVAGCLLQGKVYAEIRKETGASSATVSRVNRMLNYGNGAVAASVRRDLEQAVPQTGRRIPPGNALQPLLRREVKTDVCQNFPVRAHRRRNPRPGGGAEE